MDLSCFSYICHVFGHCVCVKTANRERHATLAEKDLPPVSLHPAASAFLTFTAHIFLCLLRASHSVRFFLVGKSTVILYDTNNTGKSYLSCVFYSSFSEDPRHYFLTVIRID